MFEAHHAALRELLCDRSALSQDQQARRSSGATGRTLESSVRHAEHAEREQHRKRQLQLEWQRKQRRKEAKGLPPSP